MQELEVDLTMARTSELAMYNQPIYLVKVKLNVVPIIESFRSTFTNHLHHNFSITFLHAVLGNNCSITLRMIHSNFNRIRIF